ncbi:Hsp20/alpha crystallin family protein, partial [Streptococcus thermophilus]|nr:Hsp20/alpha crystallin family protein [Streptococcus thermophilus]
GVLTITLPKTQPSANDGQIEIQ